MDLNSQNEERLFERFGRSYKGGEIIFAENDAATKVFMILEGRVRLVKRVRLVERDIVILKAGDILGETSMTRGHRRTSSAVALGECRALVFEVDDFEALLRDQSEVSLKLINQLIKRLQASEERIENMMLRDSQSKLVNTLIKLSQITAPGNTQAMLAISPMELSSRIGLDVDSVKRGILQLKEHKYLDIIDERLQIYDVDALRKLYRLMGMKEDLKKS